MNAQQWIAKLENTLQYSENLFLYINNKKLIETDFAGDHDRLAFVAQELLDTNKTPQIRHQRLGVLLSISHGIHKDLLINLLLSPHSTTLSRLIASHIHLILNENELLNLFDEKFMQMSEFTRLNLERCIRKNCKGWIVNVIKKLMDRVQPTECVHMLAHLPSSTPDDIILDLLKQLQPMSIRTSVLVKKHPTVIAKLLRSYLDDVINSSPKNVRTKRAKSLLSSHSILFTQLITYQAEEAWRIVNEYLIEPSLQEQCPPLDGVQYLEDSKFYKLPQYTETLLKCIPLLVDVPLLQNKWKMMTVNQIATIGLCVIEKFNNVPSQRAQSFIDSFFVADSNKKIQQRKLVFEKMFSKGLSKEKFATWIYSNCENETTPPEYLSYYPFEVSSQVVKKLYEIRKKQTFQNVSEESIYWKYFYDLNNEDMYKQFKSSTSHPQPGVRSKVIQDLLFCALYTGAKVKETLEWLETRLKNDEDTCQNLFVAMNYSKHLNELMVNACREKECMRIFISIFESGITRKANLQYYVSQFYSTVVSQLADRCEVLKLVVESCLNPIFRESNIHFYTPLKPEIHKDLWNVMMPSIKNQVTSLGSIDIFSQFMTNVISLKKQEHVKKAFSIFFNEWFHDCIKKVSYFHNMENLIDIYIFKLDPSPSTITSKVKHLLSIDSRLLSIHAIQRALLGRNTHFENNFLFQYLREHVMTSEEFEKLTPVSSQSVMAIDTQTCITFHPIVLHGLRLYEYSTREVTQRLLSTFKDLLQKVVKTLEIDRICSQLYLTRTSLVKKSIKMLRMLCVEQDEMNDFAQFLQEHILKRDVKQEDDHDASDDVHVEPPLSNLEDNASRCLAELVQVFSQDPTQYLDWILENICSENVLYYYSALCRISTFMNAQLFIEKLCTILKEKFDSLTMQSLQALPKNFSISVQKLLLSFLKNHVEYPVNHIITERISNLLIDLWKKHLHKDVQVSIVQIALKAAKHCSTPDLFYKFKNTIFQEAISHPYSELVAQQVTYSKSKNLQVTRDLFIFNLNALNHSDATIQTNVWLLISHAVSVFDVSAITPHFHPFNVFQNYIISAALTFNLAQKHDISNAAINVLLNELCNNPSEICPLLFNKIITPLLSEDKFKELDNDTYNATTSVWDRPVSQRVQNLATSIAHVLTRKFEEIHSNEILQEIQNKLLLPWIELTKKSDDDVLVMNRLPYIPLISSVTNWKSKESIIEHCVKRIADYFKDIQEPLRSVYLVQVASNVSSFIFHGDDHSNTIIEAISQVIENSNREFSDQEMLIACGILVSLKNPNDRTRGLLRTVREKQNALINILAMK
ncbi:hypothetical protein C9374_013325 [Naegleria lovaniensis]|uniref:Uncharacterized protein n=1 Tax=Naegleria lovaniensis TaxID=51637 RepID=A0AA88KVB9_NAELO|nr:uncharacterized protein C9374_013325 [Naegleria lovaniensis]KAG2391840.1 hypothetical protein C9374_013325 [Naegleria lovaniensis]